MDSEPYHPEPIPRRPRRIPTLGEKRSGGAAGLQAGAAASDPAPRARSHAAASVSAPRAHEAAASEAPAGTASGEKRPNAREVIERIMADERLRSGSHFSNRKQGGAPILTTGRQMANYLPERYREMRGISRWQEGASGARGRWLTEAELFVRQGSFMADFEDDCPYQGTFKSYFPTYNAMSDRQLRGYFTWRTQVRAGTIAETSLSFAYVYLYELINGIGVPDPQEGFRQLERFWQAYRAFAPEIDRFASVWLQDYAVYHGLDPRLLAPHKALAFDRALIALRRADAAFPDEPDRRRKRGEAAIPLPPDTEREGRLFLALDALSTYRLTGSRLYQEHPDALRHVACGVYVRMSAYHRRQRKVSLLESWFGEEVALPYTMFGSAVFFEPARHADTLYELDEIHRYRCSGGLWTCERYHGSRSRSPKLGAVMRAVDRTLRERMGFPHPLKDDGKTPKYLQRFIDREIDAWLDWQRTHAPRHIEIDLSQLASIRSAAAATREALLIDEEREGAGAMAEAAAAKQGNEGAASLQREGEGHLSSAATETEPSARAKGSICVQVPNQERGPRAPDDSTDPRAAGPEAPAPRPMPSAPNPTPSVPRPAPSALHPISPDMGAAQREASAAGAQAPSKDTAALGPLLPDEQARYLQALLDGDDETRRRIPNETGLSEDLLVDAINEALLDLVGDTVIEHGPNGHPQLIEDYRSDVEGYLHHV